MLPEDSTDQKSFLPPAGTSVKTQKMCQICEHIHRNAEDEWLNKRAWSSVNWSEWIWHRCGSILHTAYSSSGH